MRYLSKVSGAKNCEIAQFRISAPECRGFLQSLWCSFCRSYRGTRDASALKIHPYLTPRLPIGARCKRTRAPHGHFNLSLSHFLLMSQLTLSRSSVLEFLFVRQRLPFLYAITHTYVCVREKSVSSRRWRRPRLKIYPMVLISLIPISYLACIGQRVIPQLRKNSRSRMPFSIVPHSKAKLLDVVLTFFLI